MECAVKTNRMRMTVAFAATAGLLLTGCSGAPDGGDGEGEYAGQTLTVLNYSQWGSDREDAIQEFEKMTGAKVEHVYHAGADEIRQVLRTGGVGNIDVVQPNTTFLAQLAEDGLLDPIDEAKVPNLSKVDEAFMNAEGIRSGDELFGAPVLWGTTGLIYNPEVIDKAPDSWSALWDAKYAGKVAFRDNAENAVMFAAMHLGQDPYDPDLAEVEEALKELQGNVATYWNSVDDFARGYTAGAVAIGNYWDATASIAEDGYPIEYVVPKEGIIGWLDTWSIVKDAPNNDLAHEWINWMLSTEFQTGWANDPTGDAAASTNLEVIDELSDEAKSRIQTYNVDPSQVHMGRPISPERQLEYQDMWERVKAGN